MANVSTTNTRIGDVYEVRDQKIVIVSVPKGKNGVNYKGIDGFGQVFKIHKLVLELEGKFVGRDEKRANDFINGDTSRVYNPSNVLVSGDEVVVNIPSDKEINGKTAYVVKVNAKTIQIVIPHVGAYNVSRNLISKTA